MITELSYPVQNDLSCLFEKSELKKSLEEIKITREKWTQIREILKKRGIGHSTSHVLAYLLYNNNLIEEAKNIVLQRYKAGDKALPYFISEILPYSQKKHLKKIHNIENFLTWCFKEIVPELAKKQVYRRSSFFAVSVKRCFNLYKLVSDFRKYINTTPKEALEDICNNSPCGILFIHHDEVQQNPEYINKAIQHGIYVSRKTFDSIFSSIPDFSFKAELLFPETAYESLKWLFIKPHYKPAGKFNIDVLMKKARLYALSDPDKVQFLKEFEEKVKSSDELYRLLGTMTKFDIKQVIKTIFEIEWDNEHRAELAILIADTRRYPIPYLVVGEDIVEANKNYGHLIPLMKKVLEKLL